MMVVLCGQCGSDVYFQSPVFTPTPEEVAACPALAEVAGKPEREALLLLARRVTSARLTNEGLSTANGELREGIERARRQAMSSPAFGTPQRPRVGPWIGTTIRMRVDDRGLQVGSCWQTAGGWRGSVLRPFAEAATFDTPGMTEEQARDAADAVLATWADLDEAPAGELMAAPAIAVGMRVMVRGRPGIVQSDAGDGWWEVEHLGGRKDIYPADRLTLEPVTAPAPLSPSEIALAKVLVAYDAWPGTDESKATSPIMREVEGVLTRRDMRSGEKLTGAAVKLVERAQKAGVLNISMGDALTQAWALLRRAQLALRKVAPRHEGDAMGPPSWADVDALSTDLDTFLAGPMTTPRFCTRCGASLSLEPGDPCAICRRKLAGVGFFGDQATADAILARSPAPAQSQPPTDDPEDHWVAWRGSVTDVVTDLREAMPPEKFRQLAEELWAVNRPECGALRCGTCGEPYTKTPTRRALLCSNAFHLCRDCTWEAGRRTAACPAHTRTWTAEQIREAFGQYLSDETVSACLNAKAPGTPERTPEVVLSAMLLAYEAAALDLAVSLARETGSTSHRVLWEAEEQVDRVRVALAHCIANDGQFPGADDIIERDYLDRLSGARPLDAPPETT